MSLSSIPPSLCLYRLNRLRGHSGSSASPMRQRRGDSRARHSITAEHDVANSFLRIFFGTQFQIGSSSRRRTYNLHKLRELYVRKARFSSRPQSQSRVACMGANRGRTKCPQSATSSMSTIPKALRAMGAAFDTVCRGFPPDLRHHEGATRRLALLILRHMDRGERDVARLSDLALLDFMKTARV